MKSVPVSHRGIHGNYELDAITGEYHCLVVMPSGDVLWSFVADPKHAQSDWEDTVDVHLDTPVAT